MRQRVRDTMTAQSNGFLPSEAASREVDRDVVCDVSFGTVGGLIAAAQEKRAQNEEFDAILVVED